MCRPERSEGHAQSIEKILQQALSEFHLFGVETEIPQLYPCNFFDKSKLKQDLLLFFFRIFARKIKV
jgi:hypothetical protein